MTLNEAILAAMMSERSQAAARWVAATRGLVPWRRKRALIAAFEGGFEVGARAALSAHEQARELVIRRPVREREGLRPGARPTGRDSIPTVEEMEAGR